MLRDLASVLIELQHGMQAAVERAGLGVRIDRAETTLPMDMTLVLRNGGCALLADVARNDADASWLGSPSRLVLSWDRLATDALPGSRT